MNINYKNILMFFSHPDDETLSAGATMNKLSKDGCNIHVAIPNTGIHSRRNIRRDEEKRKEDIKKLHIDCYAAMAVLGVKKENIYLGEFADNEIDKHTLLELIHWLENLINKVNPDAIFTHHRFCTNIDHQYCHEAAVVATRPSIESHIPLYTGEVPSSTGYLKPTNWDPNMYINVSENDVDAKIRAMESYEGEARPNPHPRSPEVLKSLAKVRGSESGYNFAEAFMVQSIYLQ